MGGVGIGRAGYRGPARQVGGEACAGDRQQGDGRFGGGGRALSGEAQGASGKPGAAGFAIGHTLADLEKDRPSDDEKEFKKMIVEPPHQTQLDIRKLGVFDPGEASGYAKSVIARRGGESEHPGYHPYFTGPMNVELQRRRSSYAHSKGLPESVENENIIKRKIKSSVNNYLKSKEGRKLNDHLENIRKTIAFE